MPTFLVCIEKEGDSFYSSDAAGKVTVAAKAEAVGAETTIEFKKGLVRKEQRKFGPQLRALLDKCEKNSFGHVTPVDDVPSDPVCVAVEQSSNQRDPLCASGSNVLPQGGVLTSYALTCSNTAEVPISRRIRIESNPNGATFKNYPAPDPGGFPSEHAVFSESRAPLGYEGYTYIEDVVLTLTAMPNGTKYSGTLGLCHTGVVTLRITETSP